MQIGVSKYGGNISKIEIEIGNFEKAKCKLGTTFNQIFLTFFFEQYTYLKSMLIIEKRLENLIFLKLRLTKHNT